MASPEAQVPGAATALLPHPTPEVLLAGSGAPILLLHANSFPPAAYGALANCLGRVGQVRGLEQRPFWPDLSWADFHDWRVLGDDVLAWLDRLAPEEPVRAVGHSLGGVALAHAAVLAPERFHSLVLIEPVFLPPALLARLAADPAAAEQLPLVKGARRRRERWPDRAAAFAHLRPKPVFLRFGDVALWQVVEHATHSDARGGVSLRCSAAWEARIYATPPLDAWSLPRRILTPTLALRGGATDTLPDETWQLWQAEQPEATFRSLDGLGHLLALEDGARVGQTILGWWEGLSSHGLRRK